MNDLLDRALRGEEIAISKLLTKIESLSDEGLSYLSYLMRRPTKAHTIGITGLPGSGKSTLIAELIKEYSRKGLRVAVILVEPSSPFTMGSFMGNRIRMQEVATEGNIFIRSVSTEGNLGGLSLSALMFIEAFDGLGFDKIIIETVGAGQMDVDLKDVVHTKVVLNVPGTGDEIQVLKAGLMEIGDIYVINKAERPDVALLEDAIKFLIDSSESNNDENWKPRVVKTVAIKGIGVNNLISDIEDHKRYLIDTKRYDEVVRKRRIKLIEIYLRSYFNKIIKNLLSTNENYMLIINNNEFDFRAIINSLLGKIKESF
ncbi:MAG: methylmalonyl Co-A mutase-associated GTPase MeaB [Sulfolobaceae archaeon]|nr:methylmalonyl Co-A mutase-associated GTPase MeaB [Sulfolobaceae archaeon]